MSFEREVGDRALGIADSPMERESNPTAERLAAFGTPQRQVRKGSLIYWEISEFSTSKEVLRGLGYGDLLPRNDAKASLIKALKQVTRGNPLFYKRFADHGKFVRFTVVNPKTVEARNAEGQQDVDLQFQKEITISLEKSSGVVTFVSGNDQGHAGDAEFFNEIRAIYDRERHTIDTTQFRALLVRFIREQGFGVAMRSRGGIYFLDERKAEVLATLRATFEHFRGHAKLYALSMYDEEGTRVAVRDAAVENLMGDIEEAVTSLKEQVEQAQADAREAAGQVVEANRRRVASGYAPEAVVPARLATRTINTKREQAAAILEKINFYREALADSRGKLEERAFVLRDLVDQLEGGIPETVLEMFQRI